MYEANSREVIHLLEEYSVLKESFRWENNLSKWLIALTHTMQDQHVDIEKIAGVRDHIKKETGMFSPFRGNVLFLLSGLLSASESNPNLAVNEMIELYPMMKSAGLKQSTYIPTALYTLVNMYEKDVYEQRIERAGAIYKEMRSNHPFLTGGDDYALAILLADEKSRLDQIEGYYNALKSGPFTASNGLQMMSHILSFSDKSPEEVASKCEDIMLKLKENKLKVSATYYPAIALIALLDDDKAAGEAVEIAKELRQSKHAKWLEKGMNVMLASALVSSRYINSKKSGVITATVQVSVQVIIAAQQAAMIAAISASTAAAAANS